jgi:quercetin dioxygenase-like cupin family protein
MKIKQSILMFIKKITAGVKGRQLVLAAIVAVVSAVSVAFALTPGSGIILRNDFVRAGFAVPTDIQFKVSDYYSRFGFRGDYRQEVIQVNNARETVMQQVVIAPGGFTGWHSHPGPAVVLVKSGQLSFYDGEDPSCTVRTYSAGEAFIDRGQGHVHIGRNESPSENLELWSTYLDVPPGEAFRIDAPNPGNCGF